MDYLTAQQQSRLKANRRAAAHLQRQWKFYAEIARNIRDDFVHKYRALGHPEARVALIAQMIQLLDGDVYGIRNAETPVNDLCELFARAVLGHEDEVRP